MSDEADQANDYVELMTARALASMAPVVIPVNDTNECLCCGESVSDGRRWCNADCRDIYEKMEKG